MITPDILAFIKTSRANGVSPADIETGLKSNGWQQGDIMEAYAAIAREDALASLPPTVAQSPIPVIPQQQMTGGGGRLMKAVLILFIFCVIVGVAYAGYFGYEKYFAVTPLQKIALSLLNLKNINAFSATVLVSSAYSDANDTNFTGDITINTTAQGLTATNTIQTQGDVHAVVTLSSQEGNYDIDTDIAYRYLANNVYLSLVTVPTISAEIDAFLNLKQFQGQWIQIPLEQGLSESQATIGLKPDAMSQNDFASIYAAHRDRPVVSVISEDPESIDGLSTEHYIIAFDASNTVSLEEDLLDATAAKSNESATLVAQQKAQIEKNAPVFASMTGQVWVNKADNYPHKIAVDFKAPPTFIITDPIPVHIEATFNDFNKTTDIEVPQGSKTLQQLLAPLMSPVAPSKSK